MFLNVNNLIAIFIYLFILIISFIINIQVSIQVQAARDPSDFDRPWPSLKVTLTYF